MIWVIIIGIALIIIVHYAFLEPAYKNSKELFDKEQTDFLNENGIVISAQYTFTDNFYINNISWEKSVAVRFIIDQTNEKIAIISKNNGNKILQFTSVCGCEIVTDSMVTGGIGRAVVGGILAGDTGALVGAVTAKPHIMTYKVVIYTEDIVNPKIELVLINEKKSTKDNDYINAVQFAESINATIRAILHRN